MYVQFTEIVGAIYAEIKDVYVDSRFQDQDKVILKYFKIIDVFE